MVLSIIFSLGSLTPPFHSSAAPFVDKFTEQEHFLTENAPGVFQQPEATSPAEGVQVGQGVVLLEHGSWLLLIVTFWGLLQRGGHVDLTLCIYWPLSSAMPLQHSPHISPSARQKNAVVFSISIPFDL